MVFEAIVEYVERILPRSHVPELSLTVYFKALDQKIGESIQEGQELKRAWRGKSEREEGVCCQYGVFVRSLARTCSAGISRWEKQQLVSCVVQLTGVTICSLLAAILLCAEFRHIW